MASKLKKSGSYNTPEEMAAEVVREPRRCRCGQMWDDCTHAAWMREAPMPRAWKLPDGTLIHGWSRVERGT